MEEMKKICDGLEYDFYRTEEKYIEYGEDPLRIYHSDVKLLQDFKLTCYDFFMYL